MDDDLAAEIARIEAELAQDTELRQQQQQQQQGQPPAMQEAQPQMQGGMPAAPPVSSGNANNNAQQMSASMFGFVPNLIHNNNNNNSASAPAGMNYANTSATAQNAGLLHTPVIADGTSGASAPGGAAAATAMPAHQFSKDSDGRSIFVGNLPKGENGGPTTTVEELVQFFSDCGPILNCTVLKDRYTQELKGTAYIEFATYSSMGTAIDTKNNADFKGNTIIVTRKRSNFRPERGRGGRGGMGRGMMQPDPYQAIATLMGMMVGAGAPYRGGRGRGRGRGARGAGPHSPQNPGNYQPF